MQPFITLQANLTLYLQALNTLVQSQLKHMRKVNLQTQGIN